MKKKKMSLFLVILSVIIACLFTAPKSILAEENIVSVYYQNQNLGDYGTVTGSTTRQNVNNWRYTLLTVTYTVTNTTTNKNLNASYFLPYYNFNGNVSGSATITNPVLSELHGIAYKWDSSTKRFELPGFESTVFALIQDDSDFTYVPRESTPFPDVLTTSQTALSTDNSSIDFVNYVKANAEQSGTDTVPKHGFGTISPGESKTFKFVIKYYWLPNTSYSTAIGYSFSDFITYSAEGIPAGNVKVSYIDEGGEEIANPETLSGNIGDTYESQQKDIDGYTFKEVQGLSDNTFNENEQAITYIYTKNPIKYGEVRVKYVDENGSEILDDVILNGVVGENYSSEQKDIDGYIFKEVQGLREGMFSEEGEPVIYVYTKKPIIKDSDNKPEASSSSNSNNSDKKIEKSKNTLPHTGDKSNDGMFFLGVTVLISLAILGSVRLLTRITQN